VEQENKLLRQQAQEFESLKRKMAFAEAGIDVNAPQAKYFIKGYDGEVSAEAIRAAAQEVNLLPQQQQPKEVVDDSEKRAWARLQRASTAAEQTDDQVDWVKKLNSTRNQDEVMHLLAQMREQAQNI
jgi:Zn-dependent peptidase ImmA (M78 family)